MSPDQILLDHMSPDHRSPESHDVRSYVTRSHVARSHVARSHVVRSHVSYHMSPDYMFDHMSDRILDRMSDRMSWCESTSVTQHLFELITSTLTLPHLFSPHRIQSRSCSCPDLPATCHPLLHWRNITRYVPVASYSHQVDLRETRQEIRQGSRFWPRAVVRINPRGRGYGEPEA